MIELLLECHVIVNQRNVHEKEVDPEVDPEEKAEWHLEAGVYQ